MVRFGVKFWSFSFLDEKHFYTVEFLNQQFDWKNKSINNEYLLRHSFLSFCLGNSTEESDDTVVTHVLPQPAAESQR